MSFLNPFLLFGIAAVGVPVLIHLLNKRKYQHVVWAATRFLRISVEQNQRRLRIEDLILLLLRCLLLALLAIALARPALRSVTTSGMFGQAKVIAVLVLDNSYSMSQTNGVNSRFDRARQALDQTLDALPPGSSASLILASDISDPVIPQPTYDLTLVRKAVREAQICDRGTNLFKPLSDAIATLKKQTGPRKEIYLATDGQADGFRQMGEIVTALDEVKQDIHARIFLTGEPETHNLSVSDLKMGSDIPAVNVLQPFDVEVTNWGKESADGVRVTVSVDDDAPSAQAVIEHIPAGEARSITLATKVRDDGYHTITAAIAADHVPADDKRTLALKGVAKLNVLLVDGHTGVEARESEVFFLRHAMVPVPKAQADDYLVKCTTIQTAELSTQKLDGFATVALADVNDIDDKTLTTLAGFVRQGGGLLIFPGDDTLPAEFNKKLGDIGLLPAQFLSVDGKLDDPTQFFRIVARPLDHPIVSVFGTPESGDLASAHFYKRYLLNPATRPTGDGGPSRTVLSFTDFKPFMVERPFGQGRVVLFASTASTRWNDLPDHAGIFVPLMYRTLGWIVLQSDRQLNLKVGDRFVFQLPPEDLGMEAVISRPQPIPSAGFPAPPVMHDSRQPQADAQSRLSIVYENTDRAGEYDVTIGRNAPIKFATQADKNESNMQEITPAQKDQLATVAQILEFKNGQNIRDTLATQHVGTEFWLPFAAVALGLAVMETFLADWFSRPK